MKIALVGCGFVADYYLATLPNHPQLELLGITDRAEERARTLSKYHRVPRYDSVAELLNDDRVELVVNLTNPRNHYEVTRSCLEAGKHVYSEKPIATNFEDAVEIVELAERDGLYLTSAPCNVLSESAQTMWKALRDGRIGKPRLAYAEMDDGLIHRMRYRQWKSDAGIPWPWKDEFEVGCTLEHAGYYVTWLTAFFGPARSVTSFASCLVPDKETEEPLDVITADFSSACIEFSDGVVARLTNSIYAPHNHRLQVFGDEGSLSVDECWNYRSPVYMKTRSPLALRIEKWPLLANLPGLGRRRLPMLRSNGHKHKYSGTHNMDFCRGVAALADAATKKRPAVMSARYALHVNEIVLAMQHPAEMGSPRYLSTTFEPMEPAEWAR
jgi:predicted dehydrogenase